MVTRWRPDQEAQVEARVGGEVETGQPVHVPSLSIHVVMRFLLRLGTVPSGGNGEWELLGAGSSRSTWGGGDGGGDASEETKG